MKRTLLSATSLAIAIAFGAPVPSANAGPGEFVVAASTVVLAGNNDQKEIREARRAADRANAHNNRVTRQNSNARSSRDRGSNNRGNASRNSRGSDRGHAHRDNRSSRRDHDRHRSHTRSHHNRHRSHGHHSRHRGHSRTHSGVHIGIGSVDLHVGSSHYAHRSHRSHRHSSYRHRSYDPWCPDPYRSYSYTRRHRTAPVVVEREVVIVEREPAYRPTSTTTYELRGIRGWDYLLHHEVSRARAYFSDLAARHTDAGLPKLGYGFAQLADGKIRNAAHGIRRAFEFDPYVVAEGPGVHGFEGLVGEFAASLERRIDRGLPMTDDHWFVRGALLYYQGEFEEAMYALQAAKDAGDHSRGRVALDRLIAEKLEMYAE